MSSVLSNIKVGSGGGEGLLGIHPRLWRISDMVNTLTEERS